MRVVLISGATGGLGSRLAEGFDRKGYRVVLHYFRAEIEARRLEGILKNDPYLLRGDIRNFRDVQGMAEALDRDVGKLHVLVNNAGITRDALLLKYPESDWDDVIRTNLKGVFNSIRNFAPVMIKSGGGHIVNMSSYSGLRGKEGQTAYSASKAALLGLTSTLAKEFSEYNINVNAVIPGYLPLGMGLESPKAMEGARRASIRGNLSDPDDVVDFITYLVGARGITGQVFSLESRVG
ncbi:3-oxoacyl-[acyl-carrier protein] reductase [hydrothermal vent metagenome]|uniref:3-oxoacyl-[acyl-carrier protein] reductase n=1 Tax=hydrothermal vent metagenome TaxID=652676 RepID=A0A3B1DCI2_9ZZZZ